MRREVLLLGKYCAGLIASAVIFGSGAILSFAALLAYQTDLPPGTEHYSGR